MRHRSTRPGRQYAAIPNAAMRNIALSLEARGMLALLMTYADDWEFRVSHLMELTGIGRDKFRRVMAELKAEGYVTRRAMRRDDGTVEGSTWVIVDEPPQSANRAETPDAADADRPPENPVVGITDRLKNRPPVSPTAGFSAPYKKTNLLKENQILRSEGASDEPTQEPPVCTFWTARGGDGEAAWNAFAKAEGWPPLHHLGLRQRQNGQEGWTVPATWPPEPDDWLGRRCAGKFFNWAACRMQEAQIAERKMA